MLTFEQAQQSETSALFGNTAGTMESTAAAYELYNQPQVLTELTQWDGSTTPGSQRIVATPPDVATQGIQPSGSSPLRPNDVGCRADRLDVRRSGLIDRRNLFQLQDRSRQ